MSWRILPLLAVTPSFLWGLKGAEDLLEADGLVGADLYWMGTVVRRCIQSPLSPGKSVYAVGERIAFPLNTPPVHLSPGAVQAESDRGCCELPLGNE